MKYNVILNYYEWGGVLRTIMEICISILQRDSLASFAFIGSHKHSSNPSKSETKGYAKNQRFRVYKMLAETFFGTDTFKQSYSEKTNAYLLTNKRNQNFEELTEDIINMFVSYYQDLDEII